MVNDKVAVLAGFGLTPLAMATAQIATQAKVPQIVMAAATSTITEASPYIVRTSFTLPQASEPMADWAAQERDQEGLYRRHRLRSGHRCRDRLRHEVQGCGRHGRQRARPLRNPDFAPFLQRVSDAKPDALFVFVPSGIGAQFMKQFVERGLDKAGVKLIGTGDVVDDDILDGIGDVALRAPSPRITIQQRMTARPTKPSSKRSRRPIPACGRIHGGRRL